MVKMSEDQSIDSNNDESFVVLERLTEENCTSRSARDSISFLPSVVPNVNPSELLNSSTQPLATTSMTQSVDALMSMNTEEIQKRVQDLIKENSDLKVTLQQHNIAMKQQFHTLKMWQDEVYKVHQTHKNKFEETKQFINKITAENKELKKALAEKPPGEVHNNEANSILLAENAALQRQVIALEEKLSAALLREKKYLQPSSKEAELNGIVEQLTRQLETAERARRQLSIDVERLTAQQSRMQPPLSAPIVMFEESPSHENIQPAEQLKRYNELLLRLEKIEDEMTSMTSWIPLESRNIPFEVQELRNLLSQEQKLSASRKEAITEVRQYFQRLLSDYQTLYHDWEWLKQDKATKERDVASEEAQQNSNREKIDHLTAQLMECKEVLNEKMTYIDSLKEEIKKLLAENENIEPLRAQASVYQSDFEAERQSREELVAVKEKLAEDLRHLQRRNQQLLDELKMYQAPDRLNGQQPQRRSASHSPSPVSAPASQPSPVQSQHEESPPQVTYTCPNPDCNKKFNVYGPLERHVVQCLRLD